MPTQRNQLQRNSLIAVFITTVVIWLMGQPVWCKCGSPAIFSWNIWSSHNSQHLIDPYTFSHVQHGFVFFWMLLPLNRRLSPSQCFFLALLLECGWEILENSPIVIQRYRTATISLDYLGDSVLNSAGDIVACLIGYEVASRIRLRWSIVMFVVIELLLMLTIRDGLILNVLMLLAPIESIKTWQMGIQP
ncbi:MAG: DUF2585 family protein [Planctomycetota bacterium]